MTRPARRVSSVDVVASAVHRVVPSALGRVVDQARLDVNTLAADLRGDRQRTFSTPSRPPERAADLADVDPIFHALPSMLRAPYTLLRGDLGMLARDFRGERTSPVHPRPARKLERKAITLAPRQLEIVERIDETADAFTLVLREPSGAPFSFDAGQFLTLHVSIDGVIHKRAYSLCSVPGEVTAAITIKRIAGGLVSEHLHRSARAGASIDVLGPSGHFVASPSSEPRRLVFFAGGSGITPVIALLETALLREPTANVTLVYGNRARADVIFFSRLASLVARHGDRLSLIHVWEEGGERTGRLDEPTVAGLLEELALHGESAEHFVCGPLPMMDAVQKVLLARGVDPRRIHQERFQSPGVLTVGRPLPTEPVIVTLSWRGEGRRGQQVPLTVLPNQTVLEAALANGVSLPFSCSMGGCAACACSLVEGEMALEEPNCLTDAERQDRKVLTCVGRPLGPVTLEVP
jgi:ring-1,2-phenylacetyl-CoA epoxidase subunit PaaE